jgi:predicted AAA+ superfamily ATPase
MIPRIKYLDRVQAGLKRRPVMALCGPRQSGKTTLAGQNLPGESLLDFDLEDPVVAVFENPMSSLAQLRGLVVIDEGQWRPQVSPVLRVLLDREDNAVRFFILENTSPEQELGLEKLIVGYPGQRSFELGKTIRADSVETVDSEVASWKN